MQPGAKQDGRSRRARFLPVHAALALHRTHCCGYGRVPRATLRWECLSVGEHTPGRGRGGPAVEV